MSVAVGRTPYRFNALIVSGHGLSTFLTGVDTRREERAIRKQTWSLPFLPGQLEGSVFWLRRRQLNFQESRQNPVVNGVATPQATTSTVREVRAADVHVTARLFTRCRVMRPALDA